MEGTIIIIIRLPQGIFTYFMKTEFPPYIFLAVVLFPLFCPLIPVSHRLPSGSVLLIIFVSMMLLAW